MIDGRPYRFQVGQAYEINNQKIHGVMNKGTDDRITFIFDYVPRQELERHQHEGSRLSHVGHVVTGRKGKHRPGDDKDGASARRVVDRNPVPEGIASLQSRSQMHAQTKTLLDAGTSTSNAAT